MTTTETTTTALCSPSEPVSSITNHAKVSTIHFICCHDVRCRNSFHTSQMMRMSIRSLCATNHAHADVNEMAICKMSWYCRSRSSMTFAFLKPGPGKSEIAVGNHRSRTLVMGFRTVNRVKGADVVTIKPSKNNLDCTDHRGTPGNCGNSSIMQHRSS